MISAKNFALGRALIIAFLLAFSSTSFAGEPTSFKGEVMKDSVTDLKTVGWMGVGGAVLGLSTLSFVEQPEDHLKNIIVGGAFGIIAGVAIVAATQATKTSDMYYESAKVDNDNFGTGARISWHKASHASFNQMKPETVSYSITF